MPRNLFLIIWRYLHLAANTAPQAENPGRLAKLRPMITLFNEVFNRSYTPYRHVSIDESMVVQRSSYFSPVHAWEADQVGYKGLGPK